MKTYSHSGSSPSFLKLQRIKKKTNKADKVQGITEKQYYEKNKKKLLHSKPNANLGCLIFYTST